MFLERNWFTGDNVNMAIGQGDVAVTPIQLANAYATFANGGTRYAPNIAIKVTRGGSESSVKRTDRTRGSTAPSTCPPEIREPLLARPHRRDRRAGRHRRRRVLELPARHAFRSPARRERPRSTARPTPRCSAAFGPVHAPKYGVTVIMEESGFGGTAAAPVARKLFDVFAGVTPPPELQPGGELVYPEAAADQPTQEQLASAGGQD